MTETLSNCAKCGNSLSLKSYDMETGKKEYCCQNSSCCMCDEESVCPKCKPKESLSDKIEILRKFIQKQFIKSPSKMRVLKWLGLSLETLKL